MVRNFRFIKAEERDADVKSAFTMGFWTGGCLVAFFAAAIVGGSLFYLGAFH